MLTLDSLIRKGFFPIELPPPFTTANLADNLVGILPTALTVCSTTKYSKICPHSIPRVKHLRRLVGIPNPLHQIVLSQAVFDNWANLEAFYSTGNLSLSTPVINTSSERAISRANAYSKFNEQIALCSPSARYSLRTDISRYYPTIYTHSIPWALHTKAVAKTNSSDTLFGNKLDKCVRNVQDRQTIGIPVGPDTSLVISEIIGTAIDVNIRSRINPVSAFRYIDDYYFCFKTYAEAEQALAQMHVFMRDYELEINPIKTKITELPEPIEMPWVNELRLYNIRPTEPGQRNDIITFFSKSFDYVNKYPDSYVLKYALRRIRKIPITSDNFELFESLILKCAIAEPNVLPQVLQILLAYNGRNGYTLDNSKIASVITELIVYHSRFNNGFEVAWSLWISKSLSIPITEEAARHLSTIDDAVTIIVALDLHSNGLIPVGLDTTHWATYLTQSELYGDHWLLAYEARKKGWLPPTTGTAYFDSFFDLLNTLNVEFYNPGRQIEPARVEFQTATPTAERRNDIATPAHDPEPEEYDETEADYY